jgi:membrane-associated phospholipid phosphatase
VSDRYFSVWLRIPLALLMFLYFEVGYLLADDGLGGVSVIDGVTWVDRAIPLVPEMIVFYMLGYVFVFLPTFLVRQAADMLWVAVVFCLVLSAAFAVFHFFPVRMDKLYATGGDLFSRITYFHQDADTEYNNFPSLHVALNLFAFLVIWYLRPQLMGWLFPLPLLIVASTLLVKQHLLIDVVGGGVLAVVAFALFRALRRLPARAAYLAFAFTLAWMLAAIYLRQDKLAWMARIARKWTPAATPDSLLVIGAGVLSAGLVVAWWLLRRRALRAYSPVARASGTWPRSRRVRRLT